MAPPSRKTPVTMFQNDPTPEFFPHQEACGTVAQCHMSDRIARIEATVDRHTKELSQGAITMTSLECNISRFNDSVERIEKALEKFQTKIEAKAELLEEKASAPNKYFDMAVSSLIQWGVPISGIAIAWAAFKSGAVAVHP